MVDASIIICAHNPRPNYFDRVLQALRDQTLTPEKWELLIVDNASKAALAPRWDISWHPHGRHIREEELGLAAARRRGMAEAAADILVFVDDDNVLAPDYLSEALSIGQEWPELGTWGAGVISPEFEREPADYLKPYLVCLAIRDYKRASWSNVPHCQVSIPNGAGMCVRACVAREYCLRHDDEKIQISGRKGTSLVSHEDYEVSYLGCSLGFGMGVFPELRMTHLIPKERVSDGYLLRLVAANAISGGLLEYKWLGKPLPNPFSARGLLSMVKNVVLAGNLFQRREHLAQVRGRIRARRELAKCVRAKAI
jgi:glycosyltransferase involved in cell wall biosynthesis